MMILKMSIFTKFTDKFEDDFKDDLEEETNKLIEEMKSKSREEKLLKIKAKDDLDKLQAEETKRKAKKPDETRQILSQLVRCNFT